jgi:lambda repressor-like predicted transcriptional regulator
VPLCGDKFQPGKILHDAIAGALRSNGLSLDRWCRENGYLRSTVMQATHGQMCGPKGLEILDRLIADAGVESVQLSYRFRILNEAKKFSRGNTAHNLAA